MSLSSSPQVLVFNQDSYGDTALHDAISKNNQTVIDLLLSQKFDPTVKTSKGFNALHYAALKGNL